MMSKLLSFVLLGAGILCGFCAAARLKERELALWEIRRLLLSLKLALEYGGAPLGVILQTLFADARFSDCSFLQSVLSRLAAGEPLPQAWSLSAQGESRRLGEAGAALLGRLGPTLGTTDKQGQSALLDRALAMLETLCGEAAQKRKRCASLYRATGAFAGFAVFILLI